MDNQQGTTLKHMELCSMLCGSLDGRGVWGRMDTCMYMSFPGSLAGKESACNVGDLGSVSGVGRSPGGGHGNPLQYSCLKNLHGQRSMMGCSPWGHKELDTTEQLSTKHI